MSGNWYKKGLSGLILPKPETRRCCVCGKKFRTDKKMQEACMDCLDKDNGYFFAEWYCRNNPITVDIEDLIVAFQKASEHNRTAANFRGMRIEK